MLGVGEFRGWGVGVCGMNGAGSSAKFVLFGFFFLFRLMYIFIIIIIYEFPSNRSFLLTRGRGRVGVGGAEASDPRNLQGGAGSVPSKDIFDLVQPFHKE